MDKAGCSAPLETPADASARVAALAVAAMALALAGSGGTYDLCSLWLASAVALATVLIACAGRAHGSSVGDGRIRWHLQLTEAILWTGLVAAVAYHLLVTAQATLIVAHRGHYLKSSVGVVGLAALVVGTGLAVRPGHWKGAGKGARELPRWPVAAEAILWVALAGSIGCHALLTKRLMQGFPVSSTLLHPPMVLAGLVAASYLWQRAPGLLVRLRFPLLMGAAAVAAALCFRAIPAPHIDVWVYQQIASRSLLRGENPYTIDYPNIYGKDSPWLAPTLLSADATRVVAYPYPPLTVLADLPGLLLGGDVRWVMAAALLFASWAIREIGNRTLLAELAAGLLLFQPLSFSLLTRAWTEPQVLAALTGTVLLAARWKRNDSARKPSESGPSPGWVAAGIAGALLVSSKQYSPLLVLPLLLALPEHGRIRAAALASVVALALFLPFVAWDVVGLVRGVVLFQVVQPLRLDALSWLAVAARQGVLLPVWPSFALAGVVLALALRRNISLRHAMLTAAAALVVFLAFNKQAFGNYYSLALGLLCTVTVLADLEAGPARAREQSDVGIICGAASVRSQ
jgi:hypothetical protein